MSEGLREIQLTVETFTVFISIHWTCRVSAGPRLCAPRVWCDVMATSTPCSRSWDCGVRGLRKSHLPAKVVSQDTSSCENRLEAGCRGSPVGGHLADDSHNTSVN
jgi:hypothetical protein